MRLTGGRVNMTGTNAVVVLHHIGAKTGQARQTPLLYFTEGENVILVAGNGGLPSHPAWLHNVRANPNVELWVGKRGGPYRARVANAEERATLWPKASGLYSGYERYQELARDREIELVICAAREGPRLVPMRPSGLNTRVKIRRWKCATEVDGGMFSPSMRAGFAVHSAMWNVPPCTTLWSLARVRPG